MSPTAGETASSLLGLLLVCVLWFCAFSALLPSALADDAGQKGGLKVEVVNPKGSPVLGVEVCIWHPENPSGPPHLAGYFTDEEGLVTVPLEPGDYLIGFNAANFPGRFTWQSPDQNPVSVVGGEVTKKVVQLKYRSGVEQKGESGEHEEGEPAPKTPAERLTVHYRVNITPDKAADHKAEVEMELKSSDPLDTVYLSIGDGKGVVGVS